MRRVALLLVGVLLAAIAVNLAQFRSIDEQTVSHFRALHREDTADLTLVMRRECASCRERYDPHLALAAVAPGARVVIPTPSRYGNSRFLAEEWTVRFYAFGDVAEIDWVPIEGDLLAGVDPGWAITAAGPGGPRGAPWALAVDPAEAAGAPDRTFVLVRWEQPRPGSEYAYQDLLLEASLLPPATRDRLLR